jgi:hypothetical protein
MRDGTRKEMHFRNDDYRLVLQVVHICDRSSVFIIKREKILQLLA